MPAQWKQKLAISIAFAALVYVCLSLWSNHVELKAALASFRWTYIPLLLLLSSTNFFLRFLKWQYYLRILDLVVPRLDSLLIFLSGFSMAVTPGKIGEILKSYLLRDRFSIPIAKTAPIVLADRLTDMVGLVVITTIGAVGFHYGQRVILIIGFILIGTIVLFSQRQFFEFLLRLAQPIPLIAKKTDLLRTLYDSSSTLLTPRALLVTIPVSVISWSCEGLAFI